ncbi:MAG: ATP synthase F1 subunit epsilon [Saccharofermentans sp.]|nr:ATP synthase F1 subunit epsilon [Clostridiales bacterium]MCR5340644.1 ATP synthase F1 subunit epsilon [Saccharofermentans sp.]
MAEETRHKIHLIIITPKKTFYEGLVSSAGFPTIDGEFGVMAGHTPFVAALFPGTCTIRVDDDIKHCVISEGYAEINQRAIIVICNSAEWPEEIKVRQIFESYRDSMAELERQNKDGSAGQVYAEDVKRMADRSLARMRFIEHYGSEAQKSRLAQLKEEGL